MDHIPDGCPLFPPIWGERQPTTVHSPTPRTAVQAVGRGEGEAPPRVRARGGDLCVALARSSRAHRDSSVWAGRICPAPVGAGTAGGKRRKAPRPVERVTGEAPNSHRSRRSRGRRTSVSALSPRRHSTARLSREPRWAFLDECRRGHRAAAKRRLRSLRTSRPGRAFAPPRVGPSLRPLRRRDELDVERGRRARATCGETRGPGRWPGPRPARQASPHSRASGEGGMRVEPCTLGRRIGSSSG
jgi:hypothetical protein